nr:zinc finger, CCHC-type [Tanacetum cinerariifolium]
TYNKAMQSQDSAFCKEAIDDEIGSVMENNTWVLSDLPPGCKPLVIHQMDVKTTFLNCDLDEEVYMKQPEGFIMMGNEHKWHLKFDEVVLSSGFYLNQSDKCVYSKFDDSVDKTKKFLLSRFSMKDMGEAGVILVSTPMDPVEKLKPNTGKPIDQLEYSRAIGCLMYAMTSTRPDIAYVVGRLSRFTSNPSRQHWKEITRVFKYLKGTKDYGLSYVGYPSVLKGAILWDSNKQTCITGSTIESEFVALASAGKEAEWLRNLIHEISLWPKPIAPISIRCDSAPTMARAYSQIYNGKYRHLGVRHSMVRELIRNSVISIEFVRTQHNLADHLTKGLARDLTCK